MIWNSGQAQHQVGPDLGPNCSKRLSLTSATSLGISKISSFAKLQVEIMGVHFTTW